MIDKVNLYINLNSIRKTDFLLSAERCIWTRIRRFIFGIWFYFLNNVSVNTISFAGTLVIRNQSNTSLGSRGFVSAIGDRTALALSW